MFILHLKNGNTLLFIHNAKCAGVMVRRQFKAMGMKKYLSFQSFWGIYNDIDTAHIPLSYALNFKPDLQKIIDNSSRSLTPFAIVRNPYDRLWSGYQFERTANWIPQNPLYYADNVDINTFIKENLGQIIEDQRKRFEQHQNMSLAGIHFIEQSLLLCNGKNDSLKIEENNLLREECVETDFPSFLQRVGAFESNEEYEQMIKNLKPQNCSNLSCPPQQLAYTQYFNAESIDIINELYADDFDRFGYDKIDPSTHDTTKLKGYFGGQSSGKL